MHFNVFYVWVIYFCRSVAHIITASAPPAKKSACKRKQKDCISRKVRKEKKTCFSSTVQKKISDRQTKQRSENVLWSERSHVGKLRTLVCVALRFLFDWLYSYVVLVHECLYVHLNVYVYLWVDVLLEKHRENIN